MRADIRSLTDHASYVASTTVFLLDATLGLINIEQNAIIKIVSVVSVLIMPPTLVASIYGMNFRFMPELDWPFGYPLALAAMVARGDRSLLAFQAARLALSAAYGVLFTAHDQFDAGGRAVPIADRG